MGYDMDDYEAERLVIEAYRGSEEFKSKAAQAKRLLKEMHSKIRSGPSLPSMPGAAKTLRTGR